MLTLPALLIFTHTDGLSSLQVLVSAGGMAAAVIIYIRVSKLEENINNLTALRDEVTEKNLQLSQQNMRLAEAQDNEIHLATLRERNRIAREIHDNVGHMLTRSLLQSGALLIINKDEELREPLSSLKETLDSAMTSIRQSVHDLHDDSIDLKKVISDSLESVSDRFAVRLDYDISESMSGSVKLCIAGVVKECISNAAKHSTGDRLTVILREHPVFYQLMVEDNGSCTEINDTGIGLKNMTERAENAGGRITFTPSPNGFRVFMTLPKK
jgi:signal transduction histidine kinase